MVRRRPAMKRMRGIIIIVIVTAQMVLSNAYFQNRVWRKYQALMKKEG